MKQLLATIIIVAILVLAAFHIGSNAITYYNQSVNIESGFNRDINKRTIIFDKMKKLTYEQFKVAKINDSSYSKLVEIISNNRKDGEQLFWKWVTENNPNVNYNEVSQLYNKLFDNLEGLRNELVTTETVLQSHTYNWEVLHKAFPSRIYLFYQEPKLDYKPIISTYTNQVIKTGIDDQSNL